MNLVRGMQAADGPDSSQLEWHQDGGDQRSHLGDETRSVWQGQSCRSGISTNRVDVQRGVASKSPSAGSRR
jgi:hypothetical protein